MGDQVPDPRKLFPASLPLSLCRLAAAQHASVLRTVMWLAYLSADSVAIFVLGHLAVRESGPRHQLISLWAPFVLVHLGGQDTITAFSKQDNELWRRHLLSLVSQAAVAGYVVAKASWPGRRVKAAMVLIYLSGCFKYAERSTICLWLASPAKLRQPQVASRAGRPREYRVETQQKQAASQQPKLSVDRAKIERIREKECESMSDKLGTMLTIASVRIGLCVPTIQRYGLCEGPFEDRVTAEIMSVDAPLNQLQTILIADDLPSILEGFRSREDHCSGAYAYVGEGLVRSYRSIFTKAPFREGLGSIIGALSDKTQCLQCLPGMFFLLCNIFFAHVSTLIALKLFMAARKDHHQNHLHDASRADIAVSYILLVGAVVIDVVAAARCFFHCCVQRLPWNTKQWSEQLAQYSVIRRYAHTVSAGSCMQSYPYLQRWVRRRLGAWGARFFDVTHTPIALSMKEFILDNLLASGVRKEWNIASTRGQLALNRHLQAAAGGGPDHQSGSRPTARALARSISGDVDFPTSVLIWHIATEMCYYFTEMMMMPPPAHLVDIAATLFTWPIWHVVIRLRSTRR
ncbi:hypothetical protein C2845_PM11G17970 [Panicum miliaceum]|uniref:DUF4220 domain-containing protein n=1 Tax=Panicum miliaceum TaxID=4540 RepID=A0A3L6RPK8_PANMI|nr:hypothetical protein C2845_PM11G17970 [Panicum miliaceum]